MCNVIILMDMALWVLAFGDFLSGCWGSCFLGTQVSFSSPGIQALTITFGVFMAGSFFLF